MDNDLENNKLIFKINDKDNDGYITKEEFIFILNNMDINYNLNNFNFKSEKIDFNEFNNLLKNKFKCDLNYKKIIENFKYIGKNNEEIDIIELENELIKYKNISEENLVELLNLGLINNNFNIKNFVENIKRELI